MQSEGSVPTQAAVPGQAAPAHTGTGGGAPPTPTTDDGIGLDGAPVPTTTTRSSMLAHNEAGIGSAASARFPAFKPEAYPNLQSLDKASFSSWRVDVAILVRANYGVDLGEQGWIVPWTPEGSSPLPWSQQFDDVLAAILKLRAKAVASIMTQSSEPGGQKSKLGVHMWFNIVHFFETSRLNDAFG